MSKFKAAFALGALLCAAATPASAAVITQSGTTYGPIMIDQFSAPYKLDSVTYSVTYGLSARLGNMEPMDVLASYTGYIGSQDFGFITFTNTVNLPATTESFVGGSGSTTGEITSDLARFVGDGKFQSNPLSSFFFSTDGGRVSYNGGTSTSATYSISYNFDDTVAVIPEPSTWALMLAGFGMVGYAMRRRKVAVA